MKQRMTFRSVGTLAGVIAVLLGGGSCSKGNDRAAQSPPAESAPSRALATADSAVALCSAHGVPAVWCYLCDPSRREAGRLWCAEHARYEDRCWLCHPELRDAARLYCEEHSLYEDECVFCHPELAKPKDAAPPDARSELAPTGGGVECREHGVLEAECGICHPELADALEPGEGLKVRFPSAQSADIAGIRTAPVREGTSENGLETFAELVFNQNEFARIVSPVTGTLHSILVDLGETVGRGTLLARIQSGQVGEAVSRAILAGQTLEREQKLRAGRVSSEGELQAAVAADRAAGQELRTLGFTDEDLAALGSEESPDLLLPVRAPLAGEIVERNAVSGTRVEAGMPLFAVADRSTMWAMLSIPEQHLGAVRVGQKIELRLDSFPDQPIMGTLTWVSAEVNEHTRLARARAEIPNPDGRLRAHMFARVRILTSGSSQGMLIPASAVQRVNDRPFVFLKLAEDLFEARRVSLAPGGHEQYVAPAGVHPGDLVVIDGSYFVKSQLLLSRLGAGCVD